MLSLAPSCGSRPGGRRAGRGALGRAAPGAFRRGVAIKELVRRTGLSRNTVRAALRSAEPPVFRVPERPSKLDPFKDEIHRLLRDDPKLSGVRVREEIESLGFVGGKSIVDDYLREIRPMFLRLRTHQRTVYRPGEVCQWDLWETSSPVPVGHGQVRRAWVVVCCLGYSRAGAGALAFSKEAPDVLWGMTRCVWSLGAFPQLLVWDREGCLHAGGARPTLDYAACCGQLPVGWLFCEPADPQAKGWSSGCRAIWRRTSSPAGGSRIISTFSCSLTRGLRRPTRGRTRRCASARSTGCSRSAQRCARCPRASLILIVAS